MGPKNYTILFIVVSILVFIDSYLWIGYHRTINPKLFKYLKWFIPFSSFLFFFGLYLFFYRSTHGLFNASKISNFIVGLAMGLVVVKLMAVAVLIIEDVFRSGLFLKDKLISNQTDISFPQRRNFIRSISLGAASLPFLGTIYAITKGKYNYHNKKIKLFFKELPEAFDGFKIVQFSDFHAGSFDDYEKVKQGLALINEENPDLIVFTGDLINNRAEETLPYLELLKNLQAKHGKIAILGNHDYGDYAYFATPSEKIENFKELENVFQQTGFRLLKNESVSVEKNGEKIDLIGVENWGTGPFPQYGNIDTALEGIESETFKILLSHDPDHWEHVIKDYPTHISLTLSGHTHGFQMGVNIPGWKWSPSQYRYKRWLGLYEENNRFLFVSKGFGFLGFPGRIGMTPEIVTFQLYRN